MLLFNLLAQEHFWLILTYLDTDFFECCKSSYFDTVWPLCYYRSYDAFESLSSFSNANITPFTFFFFSCCNVRIHFHHFIAWITFIAFRKYLLLMLYFGIGKWNESTFLPSKSIYSLFLYSVLYVRLKKQNQGRKNYPSERRSKNKPKTCTLVAILTYMYVKMHTCKQYIELCCSWSAEDYRKWSSLNLSLAEIFLDLIWRYFFPVRHVCTNHIFFSLCKNVLLIWEKKVKIHSKIHLMVNNITGRWGL